VYEEAPGFRLGPRDLTRGRVEAPARPQLEPPPLVEVEEDTAQWGGQYIAEGGRGGRRGAGYHGV
jgi:hypothetical protein